MTERDKFEQWASEQFPVEEASLQEILRVCRAVDRNGVEGYEGLESHGLSFVADDMITLAWLSRKDVLDSVRDAEAEIKRSHDEIERLTGEVAELRLTNRALDRHLTVAEAKLRGSY